MTDVLKINQGGPTKLKFPNEDTNERAAHDYVDRKLAPADAIAVASFFSARGFPRPRLGAVAVEATGIGAGAGCR